MNKKNLTIALSLLSIIFLLSAIAALMPRKQIALDQTNKVFIVSGDVKIKKAKGTAEWQKMDASAILEKGDMIEASRGSTADIMIGSNAEKMIKVEENSHVEFQGINPADLDLPRGKILVELKKLEPRSSFTVKTPTAVCGTRGTAWSVEASEAKTKLCVFENEIYARELAANGKPRMKKHIVKEMSQRTIVKGRPISEAQKIGEDDLRDWNYWDKTVVFMREGKLLVNDFNRKENFNNLKGPFGSWVVFYSDANQRCKDEFTAFERIGGEGHGLKLDYDVDSPFSAYNGFFTNLMGVDISDYKYLVFHIKGDGRAGHTTMVNVELKNKYETGKTTVEGITDEWRKIIVPLDKFAGIKSFKDMKELVILFTDLNATKKEGTVYIDDIYFSKNEPLS